LADVLPGFPVTNYKRAKKVTSSEEPAGPSSISKPH
jgi:hypothetical protein